RQLRIDFSLIIDFMARVESSVPDLKCSSRISMEWRIGALNCRQMDNWAGPTSESNSEHPEPQRARPSLCASRSVRLTRKLHHERKKVAKRLLALSAKLQKRAERKYQRSGRKVRVFASFKYKAKSWDKKCRVIAKAEHGDRGANPRYVVTNLRGSCQAP